jgi:hypothetical protein
LDKFSLAAFVSPLKAHVLLTYTFNMRAPLTALLLAVALNVVGEGSSRIWNLPSGGQAMVVNTAREVDMDKLTPMLEVIIQAAETNGLERVRTIISAQHTVVKDALRSPVIVLAWGQPKQQLLIPIESNGSRIIRIQGEHYTFLSLPATSPAWGFERCFRRSGDVTQTPDVVAPNGLSGRVR